MLKKNTKKNAQIIKKLNLRCYKYNKKKEIECTIKSLYFIFKKFKCNFVFLNLKSFLFIFIIIVFKFLL